MSNEVNEFKEEVSGSVKKLFSAPRIKEAFSAAATPLKVAGGALLAGLLFKPALLVAFGAAAYGAYKGVTAYQEYKAPAPPPSKPGLDI